LSVARVSEITATSDVGFDDAIKKGIERATSTLRHVMGAWVEDQEIRLDEGRIKDYKVTMKVTFLLE
jgi:flavin-binding protein dodecin